jgi:hypothetical protein
MRASRLSLAILATAVIAAAAPAAASNCYVIVDRANEVTYRRCPRRPERRRPCNA